MSQFIYVTYIRSTQQKVWEALTMPEFQKLYWFGTHQETDWKPGSPWKMVLADGTIADAGEVLETDPPKRMVLKWQNQFRPELKAEGWSRCVMDLEPQDELVKLTITHTIDKDNSKFIEAVSGGWPRILSSLKSLLETGKPHQSTSVPKK
ncbi:MAG TPA: SRPBCC family protein [Rhizomicrobium sp.]|jgi:uncharacterized protein YndB with AHSA1/START domain